MKDSASFVGRHLSDRFSELVEAFRAFDRPKVFARVHGRALRFGQYRLILIPCTSLDGSKPQEASLIPCITQIMKLFCFGNIKETPSARSVKRMCQYDPLPFVVVAFKFSATWLYRSSRVVSLCPP
jgi:hypothetical protein